MKQSYIFYFVALFALSINYNISSSYRSNSYNPEEGQFAGSIPSEQSPLARIMQQEISQLKIRTIQSKASPLQDSPSANTDKEIWTPINIEQNPIITTQNRVLSPTAATAMISYAATLSNTSSPKPHSQPYKAALHSLKKNNISYKELPIIVTTDSAFNSPIKINLSHQNTTPMETCSPETNSAKKTEIATEELYAIIAAQNDARTKPVQHYAKSFKEYMETLNDDDCFNPQKDTFAQLAARTKMIDPVTGKTFFRYKPYTS